MRTREPTQIRTVIRLRRGAIPRAARITVETRLEEPDRIALSIAVGAFFEAVATGVFGPCLVLSRDHRIEVRKDRGVMADVFDASLSRCRCEMFAALLEMLKTSVPGIVSIEIREPDADERALLVRSLEREADATILDVDWKIDFAAGPSSHLVVRFVEPPAPEVTERTARIVRLWSELVHLGAYPPPDRGCSRAVLTHVGPGAAEELLFDFAALACGYDAFETLFQGLDGVHERQALDRVSIPYRTDGGRRLDRSTPAPGPNAVRAGRPEDPMERTTPNGAATGPTFAARD